MLKDPYASKHEVVQIPKIRANFMINKHLSKSFKKTQVSLTLARVCTVYKTEFRLRW